MFSEHEPQKSLYSPPALIGRPENIPQAASFIGVFHRASLVNPKLQGNCVSRFNPKKQALTPTLFLTHPAWEQQHLNGHLVWIAFFSQDSNFSSLGQPLILFPPE